MTILPVDYAVHEVFAAEGNPYGMAFTSDQAVGGPDERTLAVARYQWCHLARYAAVLGAARRRGHLVGTGTAVGARSGVSATRRD